MAAITGTLQKVTELSGEFKIVIVTIVPGSASDTVAITLASHGINEILCVIPALTAGQDAALANIGAVPAAAGASPITVTTFAAAGTAATDWTGATATLLIIGRNV